MENNLNEINEELQDLNVTENVETTEVNDVVEDVMEINDTPIKQPKKKKVKGLGDVIEKITETVGIEKCAECEERRKKLNKMFPFTRRALRELTAEEIEYVEGVGTKLTYETRIKLGEIYDSVFGGKTRHCSSCPGVYKTIIDRLIIQIGYQNIK